MGNGMTKTRAQRGHAIVLLASALLGLTGCGSDDAVDACALEDQDGIIGGTDVFVLRVDETGFDPVILTAQNQSDVTLTLENEGSSPAGFVVDCLPTPDQDGCAQESCFPAAARIEPIAPGASATVEFQLPAVEGEYVYRALDGDGRAGQFILQ